LLDFEEIVSDLKGIWHSFPEDLFKMIIQALEISIYSLFKRIHFLIPWYLLFFYQFHAYVALEYDIESVAFIFLINEVRSSVDLDQMYMA